MSGTVALTIGGAPSGHTGVVTVPSSLLFGQLSDSTSLNSLLHTYLDGLTSGFDAGTANFENNNLAAGGVLDVVAATVPGGPSFEEFTNVSLGGSVAGSGSYTASVTAGITDLAVQVPGNVTLTGVGATTKAVFGASSNVDYSVTNAAAGSIYLAGGANSVTLFTTTGTSAESIYSAGQDTVNLDVLRGNDFVTVLGNAAVLDAGGNAFVTAEGNATTNLFWDNAAGGSLNFTNNSSVAATVHINLNAPSARVTAYGGIGGGFFVGGTAGNNSLVGGTVAGAGVVTLVGGGSGDYLQASGFSTTNGGNIFVAGAGTETMVATSTTGSNVFGAGLNYPGGGNPAASGVIITQGSGDQNFLMGNVPGGETIFGSNAATATNTYQIVSNDTAGGGLYSIFSFINSKSVIDLVNGAGSAGSAHITSMGVDGTTPSQYDITLSDNTHIFLKGLNSTQLSDIHTATAFGITQIFG
jgi:hypothetical protein